MVVRERMPPNPVIIGPQAMLVTAQEYMTVGHFHRLPGVQDRTLIGILTDRDVRRHTGAEERTKVQAAMTETPLTGAQIWRWRTRPNSCSAIRSAGCPC